MLMGFSVLFLFLVVCEFAPGTGSARKPPLGKPRLQTFFFRLRPNVVPLLGEIGFIVPTSPACSKSTFLTPPEGKLRDPPFLF